MAQKLKIAFVLDDGLDSPDGVQQYILALGNWMSAQGHNVHYLVGETKRTDITNVHSLAKNIKVSFNGNKLTVPLPANKKAIGDLLEKEKFDVLHVQVPYSPFFGAKVIRATGKNTAVVGTFHILPFGRLANAGTRLLGMYLGRSLKRFDQQLSVSPAAQHFSKETFNIESRVLPNVVDLQKFEPKKPVPANKKLKLLFVGRLVERKGCTLLLQSISKLHAIQPELDFHLDICGRGPLQPQLEQFVYDNGLQNKVSFHGFVGEQQKVEFMQNADVSIFPSIAGESFGIVLIEAMAAGSVTLGGSNPGYSSVIGEIPESLLDVSDWEAMFDQLQKALTDSELRSRVHKKQQELVKKYDVAVVAPELIKVYHDCINKRNGQ